MIDDATLARRARPGREPRAVHRTGVLLARVSRRVRSASVSRRVAATPTASRSRSGRLLHEPRLAHGPGRAPGRRGHVRGVQPRGRRSVRADRLGAHRRADDLRRPPTRRRRAAGGCSASGPTGSSARSSCWNGRRAAQRRGAAAVRRSPQPVGRSGRPAHPVLPPRRRAARVPRRRAHGRVDERGPRRDRDRAPHRALPRTPVAHLHPIARVERRAARRRARAPALAGWVEGDAFTPAGHAAREEVEWHTDRQMLPAITALGDDFDGLIELLGPYGAAVRSGRLPAHPRTARPRVARAGVARAARRRRRQAEA